MAKPALQAPPRTAPAPAAIPPQYDAAARLVASMPGPSPIPQWPVTQTEPSAYMPQNQTGTIMAAGAPNPDPVPGEHPAMHDPAMLQAAQLLIPGDYQATSKKVYVKYGAVIMTDVYSHALSSGGSQPLSRIHSFLGLDWVTS